MPATGSMLGSLREQSLRFVFIGVHWWLDNVARRKFFLL
jgi:hypothetical protein